MLLPKRVWKDIPGWEGWHQVSNTGKVRSLNYRQTGKTKILKQYTDKDGYKQITLWKNGKGKPFLVHRLVALAFLPNPNNYTEVNHKDENKTNNYYLNLEWVSHRENVNYGTRNERHSKAMKGKNSKPILMFTLEGEFIRKFNSVAEANEFLGKDRYNANIYSCAEGKTNTAYKYHWEYE